MAVKRRFVVKLLWVCVEIEKLSCTFAIQFNLYVNFKF